MPNSNDNESIHIGIDNLHESLLIVLSDFDKLCNDNHLRYFACGGTSLGAVRHKGFIPWDDDVDIAMPRPDFEKLKKIFLPEEYCLIERPEEFKTLSFLNIHKKVISNIRAQSDNHDHDYLGIDIMPIDGVPDNWLKRHFFIYKWLVILLLIKYSEIDDVIKRNQFLKKNRKKQEAILMKIGVLIKPLLNLNKKELELKLQKYITQYNYEESNYVACLVGRYRAKEVMHKSVIGNGKKVLFENIQLFIYEKPEIYLSNIYGKNFMKLPPVEKRESHNFEGVIDC